MILVDPASDLAALGYDSESLSQDAHLKLSPAHTAQVLGTKWHEYSDEDIDSTISRIGASASSAGSSNNSYHSTLRVLSSAVYRLSKARAELEESRRMLLEKEAARRARADQLMKELQSSEQDVARRVLQSLFPDDDEVRREVQRKQSNTVREQTFHYDSELISRQSLGSSLIEALADEVPMSRSLSKEEVQDLSLSTATITSKHTVASHEENSYPAQDTPSLHEPSTPSGSDFNNVQSISAPAKEDLALISSSLSRVDRASIGDWMGTWFAKKSKGARPTTSVLGSDTGSERAVSAPGSRADESDSASISSRPGTPQFGHRKAASRSMFRAFGFPSSSASSSTPSRNRRNLSVSDMSGIVPQSAPATPSVSARADNPSPSRSAATTSVSIVTATRPDVPSNEPTPSMSSESQQGEKPPQGSSLRAIVQATRVMTSDPASILADSGQETSGLIARLALRLVQNAREDKLDFRGIIKEKNRKQGQRHELLSSLVTNSIDSDPTPTMRRTYTRPETLERRTRSRQPTVNIASFASPLFGSFLPQQQKKTSQPGDSRPTDSPAMHATPIMQAQTSKPGSVALESIIPVNEKPPTQYLSRRYTPLTSRDFHFTLPISDAASVSSDRGQEILTDRFGFIYEVSLYDHLLLLRAKECENTAPACLTGIKIADRKEDNMWPDDDEGEANLKAQVEIVKGVCPLDDGVSADAASFDSSSTRPVFRRTDTERSTTPSQRGVSPASSHGRPRSTTITAGSSKLPTKVMNKKFRVLAVDEDTPRHVCTHTIKKLLAELIDIHDRRQTSQRKEWDVFVNQRSKSLLKGNSNSTLKVASGIAGAAAMLGLSTALDEEELSHSEGLVGFAQLGLSLNRDERKEFDRLIRSGIPLQYRSKIWLESSGGLEMREPGLFTDLLASVDESSSVVREIEKDVGRTMPLNVFFGRTGAGVDKLRRVLKAYSR